MVNKYFRFTILQYAMNSVEKQLVSHFVFSSHEPFNDVNYNTCNKCVYCIL